MFIKPAKLRTSNRQPVHIKLETALKKMGQNIFCREHSTGRLEGVENSQLITFSFCGFSFLFFFRKIGQVCHWAFTIRLGILGYVPYLYQFNNLALGVLAILPRI
jgi:hypothetical protein